MNWSTIREKLLEELGPAQGKTNLDWSNYHNTE